MMRDKESDDFFVFGPGHLPASLMLGDRSSDLAPRIGGGGPGVAYFRLDKNYHFLQLKASGV
jgi:hypothetical protein